MPSKENKPKTSNKIPKKEVSYKKKKQAQYGIVFAQLVQIITGIPPN